MSPTRTQKGSHALTSLKPYTAILRDKGRLHGSANRMEWLALLQGLYFFTVGAVSLLILSFFPAIMNQGLYGGILQGAASLILTVGTVLVVAAVRSAVSLELGILMLGSALGLGLMDAAYWMKGHTSYFLMADGAVESVIFILALISLPRFRYRRPPSFL